MSNKTTDYPMFNEVVTEMKARPEADPAGILEEYVSPLVNICNHINEWLGQNRDWDLNDEPPWYEKFIRELARFDVDLSLIWLENREQPMSNIKTLERQAQSDRRIAELEAEITRLQIENTRLRRELCLFKAAGWQPPQEWQAWAGEPFVVWEA